MAGSERLQRRVLKAMLAESQIASLRRSNSFPGDTIGLNNNSPCCDRKFLWQRSSKKTRIEKSTGERGGVSPTIFLWTHRMANAARSPAQIPLRVHLESCRRDSCGTERDGHHGACGDCRYHVSELRIELEFGFRPPSAETHGHRADREAVDRDRQRLPRLQSRVFQFDLQRSSSSRHFVLRFATTTNECSQVDSAFGSTVSRANCATGTRRRGTYRPPNGATLSQCAAAR